LQLNFGKTVKILELIPSNQIVELRFFVPSGPCRLLSLPVITLLASIDSFSDPAHQRYSPWFFAGF
jgi:hypothetical protein